MNFNFSYPIAFVLGLILTVFLLKKFIEISHKIQNYGEDNAFVTRLKKIPTSGGVIIFFVFSITFIFFSYFNFEYLNEIFPNRPYLIVVSICALFFTSVYDDFNSIHPLYKLILQVIFTYTSIACLNLNEIILPLKLLILIIVIFWVYILNIINFIDGSDGFLTSYSLFFFASIFLTEIFLLDFNSISKTISFLILPILIGFLYFNKPEAKVFMGDSGSIFLGFLIGFISLDLIMQGYWKLSFILLMYPLLDCTVTLFIKIKNGHYPWARLFDYFFLGPIKKNNDHKFVLKIISIYLIINFFIFIGQIKYEDSYLFILLSLATTIITLMIYKKNS